MAESSDEWEEEEQFVLVELKGLLEIDDLKDCTTDNSYVWGADTDNPILKLNRYVFSGEYDDTLGTAVFFEETEKNGEKHLEYKCHTTRKLETVRSHLEPIANEKPSMDDASAKQDLHNKAVKEPSSQGNKQE